MGRRLEAPAAGRRRYYQGNNAMTMTRRRPLRWVAQAARSGFTLVEMLVAMTLTIFIMVILSQAFTQGLDTFSGLKAIGDMQEDLRAAANLMRHDLAQDHFEAKRRLSDPFTSLQNEKIREGFFVIGQGYYPLQSTKALEGTEDGIPAYRATDHFLHFSNKMRGNARDKFFSGSGPQLNTIQTTYFSHRPDAAFQDSSSNFYSSPWAEILWLMIQTGTTVDPSNPSVTGTPLHALYRCQYVVLPDVAKANADSSSQNWVSSNYENIASNPKRKSGPPVAALRMVPEFYSPNDLAKGWNDPTDTTKIAPYNWCRTWNAYNYYQILQHAPYNLFDRAGPGAPNKPLPHNTTPPRQKALVLSNVVSFQVEVLKSTGTDWEDLNLLAPETGASPKLFPIPFDTANYQATGRPQLPKIPAVSPNGVNLGGRDRAVDPPRLDFSILAIKVTIRIWDPKSRQTRQVTLIQDM